MSGQDKFSIAESLFYSSPVKQVAGDLNYVEFAPQSGSSFSLGENFNIKISSPDSFLDPKKCWLQFTLSATTHATNNVLALQGGSAAIKRVDTIVSGVEIESIDNYNHYVSMVYKRQNRNYHNFIRQTEFANYITAAGSVSSAGLTVLDSTSATSLVINHPLRIGLFEGHSNLVPIPFLRGGVEIRISLESSVAAVLTSAAGVSISNVRLVCGMIKPIAAYLQQFQSKLESGSDAVLPLQLVRNLNFVPNASTSQEAILTPGYLSSVRSVMGAYRADSTTLNADARNNLTEFYWMIGSKRYPQNKTIRTNTSTGSNGENLMFALASVDNTYTGMAAAQDTNGHLVYYNWCADSSFGNGEPIADGQIRYVQTYNPAPTTTGRVDFYITYDAKLKVSAASVLLDALNV